MDMEHNNSATRKVKLILPEMLAQKDDHLYIWALIPSGGGGEKPRKFHVMLNGRGNALLVRVPVPAYFAVDRRLTLTRVEIYRACSLSRTDGEAYTGAIPEGWTGSWVVKPHLFEVKPPMAGAWRFKLSRDVLATDQAEGEQGMVPPPPPALSINDNSSEANLSTASSAYRAHQSGGDGNIATFPPLQRCSSLRGGSPGVEGSPPLRSSPLARDPARMGVPCAYPPSPSATRSMPAGAAPTPHSLRETLPALHAEHLRQKWFKTFVPAEKSELNDDGNAEVASSSADDADDEDDGPSLLKRIREWDEFSSDAPTMRSSARPKRSASAPPELQH